MFIASESDWWLSFCLTSLTTWLSKWWQNLHCPSLQECLTVVSPAHFLQLEQSSKRIVVKWIQWKTNEPQCLCVSSGWGCVIGLKGVSVCCSFAPWCPACQQLQTVWNEFAEWGEDLGVNIAKVDVTEQPGMTLSAHIWFLCSPDRLYSWFSRSSLSMCCRFEREVYHHSSPNYLPVSFFTFTYI